MRADPDTPSTPAAAETLQVRAAYPPSQDAVSLATAVAQLGATVERTDHRTAEQREQDARRDVAFGRWTA